MAKVISTRTSYAPHLGLPELTGGVATVIPDELLPLALSLYGVAEVEGPKAPDVPAVPTAPSDLPETAWENQIHPVAPNQ